MNTLADGINQKLGDEGEPNPRPELIVGVCNSRGFEEVPTLKPTFKQKAVRLNLLGNGILLYFKFSFVFLLHEGPGEVVGVALDVIVVHHAPELLTHRLDPRLPAARVVEHFYLVRELET